MAFFSKNIDMLNGTIWDKMVVFAIPLALTGVLQQLYNLADVAVLGHFVSNEAVCWCGLSSYFFRFNSGFSCSNCE